MNIRYPIYEGVYRILTTHKGNKYNKIASILLLTISFHAPFSYMFS